MDVAAIPRAPIADACRTAGLDLLVVFGSQVSGSTHAESDIDLGFVKPREPLSLDARRRLEDGLARVLGSRELDLVDLRRVPGLVRHLACERGAVLFETRSGLFEAFRVLAWNLYQDERIAIRRHDAEGLRRALETLRA